MSIYKKGSLVTAERITIDNWRKQVIGSQVRQDPKEIDIQSAFDIDDQNFIYVRTRAVSAGEFHGPNGNGDYFPEEELQKSYKTFIRRGNYLDHDSDSVDKAVGIILDSKYWEEDGTHYVECLLAVDKSTPIAHKVAIGTANSVSMGAIVDECQCNLCGKTASSEQEYCEHLRSYMGKVYNGRKVYAINKGVNFYELSWVGTPADKEAVALEVLAEQKEKADFNKLLKLADVYQGKTAGITECDACDGIIYDEADTVRIDGKYYHNKCTPKKEAAPVEPGTDLKGKPEKKDPNFDQVVTEIVKDETEKGVERALVQKVRDALKKLPPEKLVQREVSDDEILQAVKIELSKKLNPDVTSVSGALKQNINSALQEIDEDEKINLGEGYSVMEVGKVAGQSVMQLLDRGRATGLYTTKHADELEKEAVQKYYIDKFSISAITKTENEKELQTNNEESVMQGRLTIKYIPGTTLEDSVFIARKGNLEAKTIASKLLSTDTQKAILAFEKKAQGKTEYGVGDYDITKGKVDVKIEEGKEKASPSAVVNGIGGKTETMPKEYDITEGKVDVKVEVGKEPIQPSQVVSKYASLINGKVAKLSENKETGVIEAVVEGGSIARLAQLWQTRAEIVRVAAEKKEAKITGERPSTSWEPTDPIQQDPKDHKDLLARETPPPVAGTGPSGSRGAEEVRYFGGLDKGNLSDAGPDGWARKVASLNQKVSSLESTAKALETENKILKATLEKTKKAQEDEKKGTLIDAIMQRLAETGALEADQNEILQLKDEKGLDHDDAVVKATANAKDRQLKELSALDITALEKMKNLINRYSMKTENTETEQPKPLDIPIVRSDPSDVMSLEDKLAASW